jgi:hypothetical protein
VILWGFFFFFLTTQVKHRLPNGFLTVNFTGEKAFLWTLDQPDHQFQCSKVAAKEAVWDSVLI